MNKIFFNGKILTMENETIYEAIIIKDGLIEAIGTNSEILNLKTDETSLIDLEGKTLMPAFIDPHSHLTALANTLVLADLSKSSSFDEIISILSDFKEKNNIPKDKWIMGFGYDHNSLIEKEHPTKDILDKISLDNPILIAHASGHMGAINTKALEIFKIDENSENPTGGLIGRVKDSNIPNGYLEENAFMTLTKLVEKPSLEDMQSFINKAEDLYASFGITTVQDGMTSNSEFYLLNSMSNLNRLKLDVISYIDIKNSKDILINNKNLVKDYINNYKIGGFKMFQDGSPQGRTAWLTKAYEGEDKDYVGYPIYSNEEIEDFIKASLDCNVQLLSHCNGDAAADQFISSYEKVLKENNYSNNIRPVMVHAQTVRHDQLDKMKNLNMIPSFFIAHINKWGDVHIKNLGMERASKISPAGYALKLGIPCNFHQDTPVIPPNMLHTVWTAVNRITESGVTLGEDEKISVFDALKGITINAAYEYFEEDKKGTLTKGKLADLVILDKNPLEVPTMEIKDIKVLETIKNGNTVYN
ncbi:MAG: amidohydrolase [Clostridium sp.]